MPQKPQQPTGQQYQYGQGPPVQTQPKEYTFGQRVESGNNSAAYTGQSSIKLHAPPGGRSQITLN